MTLRQPGRGSTALALLLLAGCRDQGATAPWLTMPSAATHAIWFPIGPGDTHGPAAGSPPACDGCHFDKGTGLPSSTFRTYTCTGCHAPLRPGVEHGDLGQLATFHAVVATYGDAVAGFAPFVAALQDGVGPQAAEDGACLSCHPSGLATDHARLFPLPHQDAARTLVAHCSDCHVDPLDRRRLGCADCHPHDRLESVAPHADVPDFTAAASSAEPDVVVASALCLRCHAEGAVPVTVAGHAARSGGFVVGIGLHSGPFGGACTDCHRLVRTDKPYAADFTRFTCGAACHGVVPITAAGSHDSPVELEPFHVARGVAFGAAVTALGFDAACRSCHADGTGGLPAGHPFPIGDPPSHPPESCSSCHTTVTARNDPANFDCATCHLALDPLLGERHATPIIPVTDYATTSTECLFCHGDALVYRAADHSRSPGSPLDGNPSHVAPGCTACHQTARLDMPFAASWGHQTCSPCHAPGGP